MAERIIRLAGNRELRERMGKAARERAACHYGLESMAAQLADALGKIAFPSPEPQPRQIKDQ